MSRLRRSPAGWMLALAGLLIVPAVLGVGRLGAGTAVASAPTTIGSRGSAPLSSSASARTSHSPDGSMPVPASAPPAPVGPSPSSGPGGSVPPTADGIVPGAVNATSMALTAEYDATVRLDFGTRSFRVSSTMAITNTSGRAIDRLELNTIAARLGRMTVTLARSDGKAVRATIRDQTITVPLGGILQPGARVVVRVDYRATLRGDLAGSNWLFTRVNGILQAHRWLPWISRTTAFTRPNHGDPFVTPVSPRVRVTIVSDRIIRWATTGEQVGGSGTTKIFEARHVRDFAITGAPDYRLASATVGGVVVHVWGRPGFATSSVMAAAKSALAKEAALLGPYPYKTYDLAQTAGGYGMESPGLTWIPGGAGSLPYLVAHETAHQWFYGIVGSDQAREPFADEAAADFIARFVTGLRRSSRCATARLDLDIYRYSGTCYYEAIYIQGGNFLDDTRKRMGNAPFWAGIRDHLATYRFKLTTTKALLDTLDAHTPLDLVPRYEPRFPSLY
ncbi:MAG TPA: hypothetical protein VM427_08530 [Patescibacteria group bacterium]|nr:hypothetical protein [Patescibacteria group bacterium]